MSSRVKGAHITRGQGSAGSPLFFFFAKKQFQQLRSHDLPVTKEHASLTIATASSVENMLERRH